MKMFILILFLLFSSHLALASQELIEASRDGALAQVTRLLAEGDNENDMDSDGQTALILAASGGHVEVMQTLLARPEILINHQSKSGYTALIAAAEKGHTNVAQAILARPKTMINYMNKFGKTALMGAALYGRIDVTYALLARPEILIDQINAFGVPALLLANAAGHTEIAKLLAYVSFERSRAHLISPAVMEVTNLPPELSDLVTNYLTGSEDPRNIRQTQRELHELPFYGQEIE